ncbi:MAG: hypothetical protein MK171_05770 [Pirellulales bacterium]|nr:hypothetical protein [Pirellulales bacterium]
MNILNKKPRVAKYDARGPHCALSRPKSPKLSPRGVRLAPRRGILLLVVLSMLTLFLMIGTAYIVSANHFRKMNRAMARATETSFLEIDQEALLEQLINQLIRDTNNEHSVLRYHSLLRDMYGNDSVEIGPSPSAPAQFVDRTAFDRTVELDGEMLNKVANQFFWVGVDVDLAATSATLKSTTDYYNGRLLTLLGGSAPGLTSRIVHYNYQQTGVSTAVATFTLLPLNATRPIISSELGLQPSTRALINGQPFNGTGAGYNRLAAAGTARLNEEEMINGTGRPIALLPNSAFLDAESVDPKFLFTDAELITYYGLSLDEQLEALEERLAEVGPAGLGASDESYDAVDFQNMILALMPVNPTEPTTGIFNSSSLQGSAVGSNPPPMVPIPSLHRPALINYWSSQNALDDANMLRKVLLRPSWMDHPNFTGSNPDFAAALATNNNDSQQTLINHMIYGPWDVDNDNDGVRDSIWVDFGAPAMTLPDGRRVKPMAALLVVDLDGRLNVNAHGTIEHVQADNNRPISKPIAGLLNEYSSLLPTGQGFGPADISLAPVLTGDSGSRYDAVLRGNSNYPGRYGDGIDGNGMANRAPSDLVERTPGARKDHDFLAQLKQQGIPRLVNSRSRLSAYVSPPDLHGRYRLGVNNWGQPVYEAIGDFMSLGSDSPYELRLSEGSPRGEQSGSADEPYSAAELERLLRAYDADAGTLPSRLWELGDFLSLLSSRSQLTTDSYDLPVPNVQLPPWMIWGADGQDNAPENPNNDDFDDVMGHRAADGQTHVPRTTTSVSFSDLLEYRLRIGLARSLQGLPKDVPVTHAERLHSEMLKLLPHDLADGLRLDINRPVGNNRDDDNNGVVDDPGEQESSFWEFTDADGNVAPVDPASPKERFTDTEKGSIHDDLDRDGLDSDGDGNHVDPWELFPTNTPANLATLQNHRRHLLARDLYVLAMTLVDPYDLTTVEGKARTRRLAQWAINVVDFRDPDNCMTPFEYDENPFNGWEVDGDVAGTTSPNGVEDNVNERAVVWGAERPELVLTETLAWHDRRTIDTQGEEASLEESDSNEKAKVLPVGVDPEDEDAPPYDLSYDQQSRPQGAAFIEIYNPWPANPAANADTHDIVVDGQDHYDMGIDLARTHNTTDTGSPVWRLMVYKDGGPEKDPDSPNTQHRPDNDLQGIVPLAGRGVAHRSVYFVGRDPAYEDDGVAFFNDLGNPVPSVRPGRYMVVGSGEQTSNGVYVAKFGENSSQSSQRCIQLKTAPEVSDAVAVLGAGGNPVMNHTDAFPMTSPADDGTVVPRLAGDSHGSMCSVAIIDQTVTGQRRFTLSEPADGYPVSKWDPDMKQYDPILDIPLDDLRDDDEIRLSLKLPLAEQDVRTIPAFSWIYLQRLANPLLPFDKDSNPYLTVDSMGTNVTVFNGLSEVEKRGSVEFSNIYAAASFASLQRGRDNDATQPYEAFSRSLPPNIEPAPPANDNNLWATERIHGDKCLPNQRDGMDQAPDHYFEAVPDCTLGYMNEPFRRAVTDPQTDRLVPTNEDGQPVPFPWLVWNNRPYISANELLQVPAYCSSQLLHTFSYSGAVARNEKYNTPTADDTVDLLEQLNIAGATVQPTLEVDGRHGHLLNFFRADNGTATNAGIVGLHRVLEYLHVPSPFVDTETWLNPENFGNVVDSRSDPRYRRQPPFNRISNYREPGRVNSNTISSQSVYNGLFHRSIGSVAHPGPGWETFVASRRSYGTGGDLLQLDPASPTFFANPFRSADAGDLVPLDSLGSTDMTQEGVNCTMLREGALAGEPLFAASSNPQPYNDYNRNSHFRYQPLTRLDNLTTTRSNVFAAWVTVGFFEVDEAPDRQAFGAAHPSLSEDELEHLYHRVYPDGYQFGKEAGSDTGDIQRVREFAIIDRSIPAAFEPGSDHNAQRTIRLRRRIE